MKRQSVELLTAQLQEVLLSQKNDPGDPFEIAVLAGLLARYDAKVGQESMSNALKEARQLQDAGALRDCLPSAETADQMVERLFAASELDTEAERADAVLDLDELAAGVWFLGAAQQYAAAFEDAAGAIRAFPALWQKLAAWSSRMIAEAPPRQGDPASWLWQALESSQFATETPGPPACDRARRALQIPLVVSRSQVSQPQMPLHAASELPPQQPMQILERGERFELAIGAGADGQLVLILKCDASPRLLCNGSTVALRKLGAALHLAPAQPGQYTLEIDGEVLQFEVTE